MISFAQPLPIGDAVRVILAPIAGTASTRVLRKTTDDIVDQNDPAAAVVFDGSDPAFIDISSLTNGTPYFYQAFDFDGDATWTASPSVSATPAATATVTAADPLELVRSRLAAGLKNEVISGALVNVTGAIPVLTAPPTFEQSRFPMVTVHMGNDTPYARGVGELLAVDVFDGNSWEASEGWLSDYSLNITGWVLNPDERIALRKSIKKVLVGNLPVFDEAGMVQISFNQTDTDDFDSYNAPVYMVVGSFNCLSPFVVTGDEDVSIVTVGITQIVATPNALDSTTLDSVPVA
jgi:hypothetical protein